MNSSFSSRWQLGGDGRKVPGRYDDRFDFGPTEKNVVKQTFYLVDQIPPEQKYLKGTTLPQEKKMMLIRWRKSSSP